MENWDDFLIHSLDSEWSNEGACTNYLITRLLGQLVKLQLIIEASHIYSFNNIKKNVDFELAQKLFDELIDKYCDISIHRKFNLLRNEEANFNGNDYISLVEPKEKSSYFFGHFCWGHDTSVPDDYSIYGKGACHPFRIVVNLIVSNKVLEIRENRTLKKYNEIQVKDSIPFEFIKGIGIGTQQNNKDVNEQLAIYRENYLRRLNLVVYELNLILKKYGLDLPILDIRTGEPFCIAEDNVIPMQRILSKKFTRNPQE